MRIHFKRAALFLSLFYFAFSHQAYAADTPERVLILFDRSGSMRALLGGIPKIEMGRTLFAELAKEFDGNQNVAVRFFAGGQADSKEENCLASVLALPFGPRAANPFKALEKDLTAKGRRTPLTKAIEFAKADLAGWTGPRRIIIISDGMDTCGEDPVPSAEEMGAGGIEFNIVGLGQPAEMAQLAELGLSSGASFSLAGSYGEFAAAMGSMLPNMPPMPPMPMTMPGGAGAGAGAGAAGGSGGGTGGARGQAATARPALSPMPPDRPLKVEIILPPDEARKPQPVAVEVILDVSGSMAAWLSGSAKMGQAITALEKAMGTLDADHITVGFRAYGFDASVEKTPEASCPNTELLLPFATGASAAILAKAKSLSPYGYTPIAASIAAAGKDLLAFSDRRRQIVLVTDGEETCGGDPIAAIRNLAEICVDVNVHIIGFDLEPKARAEMQAIAAAGCGIYLDAPTGIELEKAMIELTDVIAAPIELDWGRFVNPVEGGKTIETAITIEDGAYTFKQHMDKGERQYFFIPLTEAQRLRMIVTAQGRLVNYDKNGKLVEKKGFDFSNFWADFVTAEDTPIKGPYRRIQFRSRAPGFQKEAQLVSRGPDGVYFRVTANSMKINKDTRFDLFIDDAGDMVTGRDAPAEAGPDLLAVRPLQDVVGHIGLQDTVDSYEIIGLSDDTEELVLVINFTDPDFKYRVLITNMDTNRRIKRFNGLKGSQSLFFDIPKDRPDLMIQIINQVAGSKKFSSYTFVLED